ncbi:hypothetical protein [Streptomyces shenzhenensis]|uniref:hypothetical protein n=1 Tax=Streptomyces shenzhenensis TaxID=943815 RepID=UPI0016051849|nr:hypothetical protein [Streptomyces shenzhenensis]
MTAERGTARPLASRLLTGDAVVILVLAVTVLAATGCEVPAAPGALGAAAGGRFARAWPGLHLDVRHAFGRAL